MHTKTIGENVTVNLFFSSIEYLHQEIWRNLCHYGEKQGLFPKPIFKAYVSLNFTSYLTRLVNCDQIPLHLVLTRIVTLFYI